MFVLFLIKIEKGEEGIAMGFYSRVLAVPGLDEDLLLLQLQGVCQVLISHVFFYQLNVT